MPSHKTTTSAASASTWSTSSANRSTGQRQYVTHFRIGLAYAPLMLILLLLFVSPPFSHAVGYSYTRFVGPVSGPEQKVFVHDLAGGGARVDYIAKPEYEFAYGVEDGKTRVLQNRKESRDGDAVKGVYSLVDPDGSLRVVKYTADNVNGFQAEVITNGVATLHGHNNAANGRDNANWYVQTGPRQEQQVRHTETPTQPQQQLQEHEGDSSSDDKDDDDDGDSKSDYEVNESNDESGTEEDYDEHDGSSEDEYEDAASKEANSYEDGSNEYY